VTKALEKQEVAELEPQGKRSQKLAVAVKKDQGEAPRMPYENEAEAGETKQKQGMWMKI
jgi:hypothetical protein